MRCGLLSLLIGAALLAGIPAQAFWQSRDSNYDISSAASYTGPIDVVASPTALYSLRAGSGAIAAAGTQTLVNIRRASDNVACDFLPAVNGNLGVTTATCNSSTQGGISLASFLGTDAVCTGSMVGTTTLTISTCSSGTLHVSDSIITSGVAAPFFITAIGTCASPPGTCTVNKSQTFAAQAVTGQVAGFATKGYDQSGANFCSSAPCDATQATAGNQLEVLPLCANAGTLPCFLAVNNTQSLNFASIAPSATTMTISVVGNRYDAGQFTVQFCDFGGGGNKNHIRAQSGTGNAWQLFGGGSGNINATANDNTWHAAQGVINGASSVLNIDGTDTTGTATGSLTANPLGIVADNSHGNYEAECMVWGSTLFNGTQRTNMQLNQKAYWGTP